MVRVLMHGCNGRMGQMISSLLQSNEEISIVAGVDTFLGRENYYPTFKTMKEIPHELTKEIDVIIDFSNVEALPSLFSYCKEFLIPLVTCTTGLSEKQQQELNELAKNIPVLKSANMSIGINMLLKLVAETATKLYPAGFDIEIVEKHHNQKLDAPSGTAIALADSINSSLDHSMKYVYDRSQIREKREKNEIGISAVRGGSIVGEHDVIFAGLDEVITISHSAYSRSIFAKGAIEAAKFLVNQKQGMYSMNDVV